MAQLVGTGKDPRYIDGQVFDVPDIQSGYIQELLDKGCAKWPEGVDDSRRVEVANAVVRGDPLSLPEDRKVAAEIEKARRAHDIVHTDDPHAKQGAHDLSPEEAAAARAHLVPQPLAKTAPDEHASSKTGASKEAKEHTPTPRDPAKDAK